MPQRVITVVGPTATGKSGLSLRLAEALGGEIVNADSMQLYRGMDIGTAKLAPAQRAGVPHHLLDVWDVTRTASVSEYQQLARAAIGEISDRGRIPILVGGSGLYVRAAIDKLEFPGTDPLLRDRLEAELAEHGAPALHARLARADPAAAAAILPGNGRRIVRALEVIELSGRPFSATLPGYESLYPAVQIGLRLPREELDRRIDWPGQPDVAGRIRGGSPGSGGPGSSFGPDGEPRPRLCAGAAIPGRGVAAGAGRRRNGAGHQAVCPAPGGVVPARSPDQLAGGG